MKQKYEWDERQRLNRGIAFQYAYISAMVIMLVVYFLIDVIEVNISIFGVFQICFWIPTTICFMTMIIKDAYDSVNHTPGRIIFSIWGVAGLSLIISSLVELLSKSNSFFELSSTTDEGGTLSAGFCFLLISVTYWIKQYLNWLKFKNK